DSYVTVSHHLSILTGSVCLDRALILIKRPRCNPSCIRVSWLPFIRFFIAHGRGILSCRALDNIERLIPFPRQQSNAAWRPIAAPRNRPATGRSRRKTARRALQAVLAASKMSTLTRRRKFKRDVTPFDGV